MSTIRFGKFTKPQFLKQVERALLARLFGQFASELAAQGTSLPPESLPDEEYFAALAQLTTSPDALPDRMIEALIAIEEMATAEGQERLELAVMRAGLALEFPEGSTHADIAMRLYLIEPALLVAQHNAARLGRLSAFEYFGASLAGTFATPVFASETLRALEADLDVWFREHNRGLRTTRIEVHAIDGELWFMVRHGDTFTRTAKLENERLEMMHFRPAKDDVVVYAPARGELRVHAGTKGEKDLYRRVFGQQLFGDAEHFCERMAYSLEPLRTDCAEVLDARGLPGVTRIVLREAEIAWGRKQEETMVRCGTDLFASARSRGREAIPDYGTITRAVFDFHFAGRRKAHRVEVRTPNTVKMGRGCDPRVVHEWLSTRGLRVRSTESPNPEREARNEETVVA